LISLSKVRLLVILCVTAFLFAGCSNGNEINPAKNFSIYLVKDLTTAEAMSKNLDDLPLEDTPLLTDKEIKIYNWKEHSFTLEKGFSLEEELEDKVSLSGKPFVVVVDSERVYLGSFWNYLSSVYNPEIPTIYSGWFRGNDKDTYTIECSGKQDPRDAIRIYGSLKGLGKISAK